MTSKQQAERLPEAVRCNAQRSALRRPTQHAAMANAARCGGQHAQVVPFGQAAVLGKEAYFTPPRTIFSR